MKFYSQDGQDKFIVELINYKKNGYFLDIGAFDGVEYSNSFYLEKELGWTGICIEPNPNIFEKLIQSRNCKCFNVCIANEIRDYRFLSISGYGVMLSGIIEFFDEYHNNRIDKAINEYGGSKDIILIPGLPVKAILAKEEVVYIDYCNIDVEGGEISVLDSIDFSKVKINLFTIENNHGNKQLRNYLKKYKYSLIGKRGADEIYELNSKRYNLIFKNIIRERKIKLSEIKNTVTRFFKI